MDQGCIRHMVIFSLKHGQGSSAAQEFLQDAEEKLSGIASVEEFTVFDQISAKNDYDYGFSMDFKDQDAYDTYNAHPTHVAFVEQRWKKEVEKFLEIDFQRREA